MLGWFKVQKVNNNAQNPRNLSIPSLKKIVESSPASNCARRKLNIKTTPNPLKGQQRESESIERPGFIPL